MSSFDKSLLQQCAEQIKRWPRLNATRFPALPSGCNFIVAGVGGYKLEINGRVFTKDQVNKERERMNE